MEAWVLTRKEFRAVRVPAARGKEDLILEAGAIHLLAHLGSPSREERRLESYGIVQGHGPEFYC